LASDIGGRKLAGAASVQNTGARGSGAGEPGRNVRIAAIPVDRIQTIEIRVAARACLQRFALYRIGRVSRAIEVDNLASVLESDKGQRCHNRQHDEFHGNLDNVAPPHNAYNRTFIKFR